MAAAAVCSGTNRDYRLYMLFSSYRVQGWRLASLSTAALLLGSCDSDERAAEKPASAEIAPPEPSSAAEDAASITSDRPRPGLIDGGATSVAADASNVAVDAAREASRASGSDASSSLPADDASRTLDDSRALAYAALSRGDTEAVDDVILALERTLAESPDDGYTLLYAGVMRMWKMSETTVSPSEYLRTPSLPDEILSRLSRARALRPADFRVPGFLGLAQFNAGRLVRNQALMDEALVTLEQAIAQYPAYGHFLRAASMAGLPKSDPLFLQALDDMLALANECAYDSGDDLTAYRYPTPPSKAPSPHVCMNEGIVPHSFEGVFMLFGDLALKAGWPIERVRALYRSAQTAPNYATWPFAPLLEERIEKAEDHARLAADANPLNDPELWVTSGRICRGCHQER